MEEGGQFCKGAEPEGRRVFGAISTLEAYTLSQVLKGRSLARFGDGELLICHGENARFQDYDPVLAVELRRILRGETPCLVGIPHAEGKRAGYWKKFLWEHSSYFGPVPYASSFISRPDEADPVRINLIWKGRDVVLVGSGDSLTPEKLKGAKSVDFIECPKRNAFDRVDEIEFSIADGSDLVVLCCGATAVVLADRLCRRGIQAVDLGYSGKYHEGLA